MSVPFQNEYEHQAVPLDDEWFDEQDDSVMAVHPSTDEYAAPPPSMPTPFVPTHTGPAAGPALGYYPAQDHFPQNHPLLGQAVPNRPVQNQSVQGTSVQYQPAQNQPGQPTFGPRHPLQSPMEITMSAKNLADYLGISDVAHEDTTRVAEIHRGTVSSPERACAEQLARSSEFGEWIRSPGSSRLLVHTMYSEDPPPVSGLSLFCMSLWKALKPGRRDRRFIPLVFFCGLHAEPLPEDDNTGATRVHGMMRSLIYQLLGLYHGREPRLLITSPQEIAAIQEGKLSTLYGLFHRLVHGLPADVTVCCLVDGAVYFERDEILDDFENVMVPLVQLAGQGITRAPFKLLVTNPINTSHVRNWFAGKPILSITQFDLACMESNGQGFERELASAIP